MKQPQAPHAMYTTLNPSLPDCPYTLGWIPSYPGSILGGTKGPSKPDGQPTMDNLAYDLASFSIDLDLIPEDFDAEAPVQGSSEAAASGNQEYVSPSCTNHAPLEISPIATKDATQSRARYQDSGIGSSGPGVTSDQTP